MAFWRPCSDPGGAKLRHVQDSRWSNLVCLCATLSQALIMGVLEGFGVFLPVIMEKFFSSRERTGLIGSIGYALTFFLCPVAGRLCDRFGSRPVVIAGSFICCLSLVLTSFVKRVELFFATYSVIFGIGSSCCRMGNFLITAKYFKKRKSLATGFVSAGSGVGLLVLGPINQTMVDHLGLAGAYRVLSGVTLLSCFLALTYDPNVDEDRDQDSIEGNQLEETRIKLTEKERQGSNGTRKRSKIVIDFSVWKLPTFTVVAVCSFFFSIVFGLLLLHMVRHCEELSISGDKASRLFIIIGLVSSTARITTGMMCDVKAINPRYVYQAGMFTVSTSVLMFGVPTGYIPLAIIAGFFGLGAGTCISVGNILLLTCVQPAKRALAFGLANTLMSIGLATSGPLGGFIADEYGSYVVAFYAAGGIGLLSACLPFILLCVTPTVARKEIILGPQGLEE